MPGDARVEDSKHRRNASLCKVLIGLANNRCIQLGHGCLPSYGWPASDRVRSRIVSRTWFLSKQRQQEIVAYIELLAAVHSASFKNISSFIRDRPEGHLATNWWETN